jgi:cytochrome b pre-mRNA-processing protein 3
MMSLRSLFRPKTDANQALRPLYDAIVATGRDPHWYLDGAVPDTLDGRFDMISLIFALVSNRLAADATQALAGVHLTEIFVTDMDGQLRQIGFGDMVVGKQVGRMMSALGGRLGAYQADANSPEFRSALIRNIWRGEAPADAAINHVVQRAALIQSALAAVSPSDLPQAQSIPGSQIA